MSGPGMSADSWRHYKALMMIRAQMRWYAKRRREAFTHKSSDTRCLHVAGIVRGYIGMANVMQAISDKEYSRFDRRLQRLQDAMVDRVSLKLEIEPV